jgi:hypothetical protein
VISSGVVCAAWTCLTTHVPGRTELVSYSEQCNLKLMGHLFLDFSIQYFWTVLAIGN